MLPHLQAVIALYQRPTWEMEDACILLDCSGGWCVSCNTPLSGGDHRDRWKLQRPLETAEAGSGDCRDQWRLQRPLETAETAGDCRDQWRLQRPVETAETSGDCRDQWRLQRLGETSGDCRDQGRLQRPVETRGYQWN